jgi:hypothetical protein
MTRRGATEREQLNRARVVAVAYEDLAALQRMTGPELARNMPCFMAAFPAHATGTSLRSGARGRSERALARIEELDSHERGGPLDGISCGAG